MSIIKKIFGKSDESFKGVRIEKLKPYEEKYETTSDTVWFSPHNIEKCIIATKKLKIEHIFLQTKTIDFLNDKRLSHIKGVSIQFEIEDLTPLYQHKQLTHLGIYEDNGKEFDFDHFKNLIFINGIGPKNYKNFDKLESLRYAYLRNYNTKDFSEFSNFLDLRILEIYSVSCQNLNGLSKLKKLKEIRLEKCPKLISLSGLGESNISLRQVILYNCKKLQDASAIGNLPNISDLLISEVHELDSLHFIKKLPKLENLHVKPLGVGVKRNDYYPLVEKLQEIGKIEQLKKWKKLDDYLNKKIDLESYQDEPLSELQSILKHLSIKDWKEKYEDGLEQYTPKNCRKAEKIISNLIGKLEKNKNLKESEKIELIKLSVLEFNELNDSLDGCFIETGEREELCDIFDNIADSVGIDTHNYEDGIASEWRDW